MRWAGHVARTKEKRNAYTVLGEAEPEGKTLWKPRGRWEDNIKVDIGRHMIGGCEMA
jgi:hypothetical protein